LFPWPASSFHRGTMKTIVLRWTAQFCSFLALFSFFLNFLTSCASNFISLGICFVIGLKCCNLLIKLY
jgi:hypothetical protein